MESPQVLANGSYTLRGGLLETGSISGSGTISIEAGKTLTLDQNDDTTFSGNITGQGGVTLSGNGTLTLTGTNTYTGETTLSGAGILVVNGASLPHGAIAIGSSATVKVVGTGAAITLSRTISGAGALLLTGDGRLNLSSSATISTTGAVAVSGTQTLDIGVANDSVRVGTLTLDSGATLTGSGTITASSVTIRGVFSPGNSPGVTTIVGNYVQDGGTLKIELGGDNPGTGSGFHDQVVYSGVATIAGGATLDVSPFGGFTSVNGQAFRIIRDSDLSTAGFIGRFTRLTGVFDSVLYDNAGATLTVYDNLASIPGLATGRTNGYLAALSLASPSPSDAKATPILDALASGGVTAARDVVTASSPLGLAALPAMPVEIGMQNADFLRSRENTGRGKGAGGRPGKPEWQTYASDSGTLARTKRGGDAPTFDHHVFGGKVGLDSGDQTVVGIMAQYDVGTATLLRGGGSVDMDRVGATAYVSQLWNEQGFVQVGAGVGTASYEVKRYGSSADPSGLDFSVIATAGYRFVFANGFDVTPYAGLVYTLADVDGFEEKNSPYALKVGDFSQNSLRGKIGSDFGWSPADAFRIGIDFAITRELLDHEVTLPASLGGNAFDSAAVATAETLDSFGPTLNPKPYSPPATIWSSAAMPEPPTGST